MYNDDQPRDDDGRWSGGGASGRGFKNPYSPGSMASAARARRIDKATAYLDKRAQRPSNFKMTPAGAHARMDATTNAAHERHQRIARLMMHARQNRQGVPL